MKKDDYWWIINENLKVFPPSIEYAEKRFVKIVKDF